MRFPVVLFDLDGTLVDSGWMILASFQHATRAVLDREIPDEVLLAGVGSAGLVEQMRTFDEQRADELVDVYRSHYAPLHDELEAFPGVVELLETLHAEGRKTGIVTAKRRDIVDLAFAKVPIAPYIDVVVGSDEAARGKPHPDPILLALARLGAEPRQAAFVGDAPFDIAAGNAAGVFTIAVTWGRIHPFERVEAEEPDAIVSTVEELRALL
jgi:pyrophosphatase PpaX